MIWLVKCSDCENLKWDGECWDTGHIAYDYWECRARKRIHEKEGFPFDKTNCKRFQMEFWKSEFAEEVDGSDESLERAYEKFKQKYRAS